MLSPLLLLTLGMIPADWYTFEPESKAFRIEMPSKPGTSGTRALTKATGPTQITTAELSAATGTFSVQVTENRGPVDPSTLEAGIRRFADARGATVETVTPIKVGSQSGREFEMFEGAGNAMKTSKSRWIAAGNSFYMLSVVGKPGGPLPDDADRFLGSLQINSSPIAAPASAPAVAAANSKAAGPRADSSAMPRAAVATPKAKGAVTKTAEPLIGESVTPENDPNDPATKDKVGTPRSTKFTISRLPRNAKAYPPGDLADINRSFMGRDRDGFRDIGPDGSVLVGVRVSYIEKSGGPKVRSVQPIYRLGKAHHVGGIYGQVVLPVFTYVAKPGYAVGGLITHTGATVDGFQLVYMKVEGDRLNSNDAYASPWIGDVQGGGPGQVGSPGALVVGLQGRAGNEVNALGLTALK